MTGWGRSRTGATCLRASAAGSGSAPSPTTAGVTGVPRVRVPFPVDFIEQEAARLPEILRVAGIGDHAAIGHSDGGTIALLYAAENPPGLKATVSLSSHVHRDPLAEAHLHRFAKHASEETLPAWMARFHGDKAADVAACWSATWLEIFAG